MQEGTGPTLTSWCMDLSRRQVLVGGASAVFLAACGSSTHSTSSSSTSAGTAGPRQLFNAFDAEQPVGKALRLPVGLANADGSFSSDLPASIAVQLKKPDGTLGSPTTIARHQDGLPRGYYPVLTTFDVTGRWTIDAVVDGKHATTTVDVKPANEVANVPGAGDPLPKIPTPTTADHHGVNPICTREPACPFHTVSLDQLIGGTKPIALLVSTPAFCQVAICGPVLDLMIGRKAKLDAAGVQVIHTEVYVDTNAKLTSPTVNALGLDYEPALFLAKGDGTIVERLDSIFDRVELDAAVAKLS